MLATMVLKMLCNFFKAHLNDQYNNGRSMANLNEQILIINLLFLFILRLTRIDQWLNFIQTKRRELIIDLRKMKSSYTRFSLFL